MVHNTAPLTFEDLIKNFVKPDQYSLRHSADPFEVIARDPFLDSFSAHHVNFCAWFEQNATQRFEMQGHKPWMQYMYGTIALGLGRFEQGGKMVSTSLADCFTQDFRYAELSYRKFLRRYNGISDSSCMAIYAGGVSCLAQTVLEDRVIPSFELFIAPGVQSFGFEKAYLFLSYHKRARAQVVDYFKFLSHFVMDCSSFEFRDVGHHILTMYPFMPPKLHKPLLALVEYHGSETQFSMTVPQILATVGRLTMSDIQRMAVRQILSNHILEGCQYVASLK